MKDVIGDEVLSIEVSERIFARDGKFINFFNKVKMFNCVVISALLNYEK